MSNVINFVSPRWPSYRTATRYTCPKCGHETTVDHGSLWVAPLMLCPNFLGECGAEMRPVEMEAK